MMLFPFKVIQYFDSRPIMLLYFIKTYLQLVFNHVNDFLYTRPFGSICIVHSEKKVIWVEITL